MRDVHRRLISDALEGLQAQHGVRMKFTLCDIPDQEDWGTADSLRHIRSKIKVCIIIDVCYDCMGNPIMSLPG